MTTLRCIISLLVAAGCAAAQTDNPDAALGAARHLEEVEGNYPAAIEAYKKFLSQFGKNRPLAAKAMLRLAECHQKMGSADARVIYERVLREYADQKDAVSVAKARLGGESTLRTKGDRAVWAPARDLFGRVSPDGRFITYADWPTGNLFLHELVANSNRPLTNKGTWADSSEFAQFSSISRDSKQVAYEWYTNNGGVEIRIVGVQAGAGIPQSKRVFAKEDISSIAPFDWSPNGKLLAVHLRRKDHSSQIGLVSVPDGSLRVMKSVDWRGPSKIFFSPDGKYIAYDLPASDTGDRSDVFVMAIDGSRESAVVSHPSTNIVMGWSPDGTFLLFSSTRTGSMALWAQALVEGKSHGAPTQLKPDGSTWSLGLTSSGALHVIKVVGKPDIRVAAIDWNAGTLVPAPVNQEPSYIASRGRPDWAPDGKQLSYISCGETGGGPCKLLIRSMDTGKVREVPTKIWYFAQPRWSPDGRSFITGGRDNKGRDGIYQIDAQNGEATLIADRAGLGSRPQWLPDGRKICYRSGPQLVERDLRSGNEEVIFKSRGLRYVIPSPDGRFYAAITRDEAKNEVLALLIPVAGGDARELTRFNAQERFSGDFTWMPDSQALLMIKGERGGHRELWTRPVNGGEPRVMNIDFDTRSADFCLHPDGRHIAYVAGKQEMEVWALENFLPTFSTKK